MEFSPRFLVLISISILFNLYTLGMLNHSYSVKSASSRCECNSGTPPNRPSSTSVSTPSPITSPRISDKTASDREAEAQREVDLAVQQNPSSNSSRSASQVQPETTREFVVMIPTARRPGGAFYLQQCVDALLASKVPPEAITVMNMDANDNPNLYKYLSKLKGRKQGVELMERQYSKSKKDLLVNDLREFKFAVKPAEMKTEGYDVAVKDALERKVWRSKEAIDFVVLSRKMLLRHPETEWFVFLQDDAVLRRTVPDLYRFLRDLVQKQPSVSVFHLNKWGNVAIMFHRYFLESFMAYANLRFDLMPIDWLLSHHKTTIGSREKVLNIFSHVGLKSSFVKNDRSSLVN